MCTVAAMGLMTRLITVPEDWCNYKWPPGMYTCPKLMNPCLSAILSAISMPPWISTAQSLQYFVSSWSAVSSSSSKWSGTCMQSARLMNENSRRNLKFFIVDTEYVELTLQAYGNLSHFISSWQVPCFMAANPVSCMHDHILWVEGVWAKKSLPYVLETSAS